jgi:hypothetical protein
MELPMLTWELGLMSLAISLITMKVVVEVLFLATATVSLR